MSELGATFAGIVTDGSLLLAIAVAALVGLISFASPCCLPLVPGYVSYVAGLAGSQATAGRPRAQQPAGGGPAGASSAGCSAEASAATSPPAAPATVGRGRVLAGSLLFIAGFSAVFVSFGALFGGLGRLLLEWSPVLTRVAGVVVIGMGLSFLGAIPWLMRERRIHRRPGWPAPPFSAWCSAWAGPPAWARRSPR